jgi:CRISPR/Cas system-associated exonuclease Cas4 (RecB family)
MEKYFRRELVEFELPSYYVDHYNEKVISSPPPYPANMAENYYNDGLEFLNNIDFDLDAYDFISSEEMIENVFNGIEMVVKPDIILYERATHQYVLLDFKTSKLSGKKSADQKKIDEYKKQLYLYVYFIEKFKNVKIEKILLWFVRNQQIVEIPIDTNQVLSTVEWFENTIRELKNEKNWEANLDKKNNYFCSWLCQMRETCEPRQKLLNDQS